MSNGPLLEPLPNGSHTLHNGKLPSDPNDFMNRLSSQTYFKTLPRDNVNTSYGTFNFLGGRLTLPNTGKIIRLQTVQNVLCLVRSVVKELLSFVNCNVIILTWPKMEG